VRTRLGLRAALTFAAAATLLTGCQRGDTQEPGPVGPTDNGVSTLAADEILDRAKTALRQATSYRAKGNGSSDGQKMSLDFRVSGTDLGGALTMDGASIEVLSVAGQQYMRPDEKFWANIAGPEKAGEVAKLMGDKWVRVPDDDKNLGGLFDIANVDNLLKPDGTLTKGETKDIDGVKAIGLVDSGGEQGTLYVATIGEPYPLRLVSRNTADGGQVDFTDFGATFDDLKAPAEAEVIDLEELSRT
jgi:hypothetical protein